MTDKITPPWLTAAARERAAAEVQRVLAYAGLTLEKEALEKIRDHVNYAARDRGWDNDLIYIDTLATEALAQAVTTPDLANQIVLAVLAACVPEVDDAAVERACDAFDNVYEAEIKIGASHFTDNRSIAMRAALLAALGGE